MRNPRLYFTIELGICYPYRGQNSVLDAKFRGNTKLIEENKKGYTKKQIDFIERNKNKAVIYYTDKYIFDSKKFTFAFQGIPNIASDDDLNDLFSKKCQFDPTMDYDLNDEQAEVVTTKAEDGTVKKIIKSENFIDSLPDCPNIENTGFYVESKNWKYLVRNIMRKKPTLLIGPTGTGKTELILMACKQLGINCEVHDMGAMQDPLTELLGCQRIKDGSSTFDYAKFVDDVQKPGVILLDELSRAPLMTNNIQIGRASCRERV